MLTVSAYGRLGGDPEEKRTKSEKLMVVARMVIDVTGFGAEDESSLWVSIVAFGKTGELLAKNRKADMVAVTGKMTLRKWRTQDGDERETWNILAEALHSSRTVRPGGGKRKKQQQAPTSDAQRDNGRPFNDPLPL